MKGMAAEQGVYMKNYRYWAITFAWSQLDDVDTWTATIDHQGFPEPIRPARFIGSGPVDRFLLHDMLKVVDTNIEIAMIHEVGIQTDFADVVKFEAPAKPRS